MKKIQQSTLKYLNEQAREYTQKTLSKTKRKSLHQRLTTDVVEISRTTVAKNLTKKSLEKMVNTGKSQREMAKELNMLPQTLVYYLKKFGLYKPTRSAGKPYCVIDKSKLQSLVDSDKTLEEMSKELQVSVSNVRHYLDEYGIKSSRLEELNVLRKYFSAKNPKEKAEAIAVIDDYLKQIAKEKYILNNATTFEDCLQDIRLRFFELANKKENGTSLEFRNLFKMVRESKFNTQAGIKTVTLNSVNNIADDMDIATKNFLDSDFHNFLIKNSKLTDREQYIVENYANQGRNISDIGESLDLTAQRVRDILKLAIEKMDARRPFF